MPPPMAPRSTIVTSAPCFSSSYAMESPAIPAPTTNTPVFNSRLRGALRSSGFCIQRETLFSCSAFMAYVPFAAGWARLGQRLRGNFGSKGNADEGHFCQGNLDKKEGPGQPGLL